MKMLNVMVTTTANIKTAIMSGVMMGIRNCIWINFKFHFSSLEGSSTLL